MPFTAAPHHEVLLLLVRVAILLVTARALAELAQRLGQPSVVGEILAGIVLGPSLLSGAVPALGRLIVPATALEGHLLEVVSLLGAVFLLLITGLETDLALIRRHARTALGVSLGGIVVPFAAGLALGLLTPEDLLADRGQRLVFALFLATAMSISAIPVIAKVLIDLNLMRRNIGQTIIAAGMIDDTVGWIMLSVVVGLASGAAVTAGTVLASAAKVAGFMVVSFTVGRWLVARALDLVQNRARSSDRLLTLVVVLALGWGALTQALGLEAVLGAFVMGILFGQLPRLPAAVHARLETVAFGIFTPVFFATAGLKVDARILLSPRLAGITAAVIAIATFGKVVGGYVGARAIGRLDRWSSLAYGLGLNARGAMEIIIATVGLSLGILTQEMFSMIVLMAIVTSLVAPPTLRWVLRRVRPGEEELARLREEELDEASVVGKINRVLLPLRAGPRRRSTDRLEAEILARLDRHNRLAVTLVHVDGEGGRSDVLDQVGETLRGLEVRQRLLGGRDVVAAILDEAANDYGLIVLGASERAPGQVVFHPIVDEVVRMAPCPTLVVKPGRTAADWRPRRMLVPTNGSTAARAAVELAFLLAGEGEEVRVLSVVEQLPTASVYRLAARSSALRRQRSAAETMLAEIAELGVAKGVRVHTEVRVGADPDSVILEVARAERADLVILGTDVRTSSQRLFLGPRVERVLDEAPCPVLVLNTPA